MPRVSQEHRAARRAEIIDAALRCFTRSGYRSTTMADIITESGLSAGAIYGYFGGKQELLVAVADHVLGDRRALLVSIGGSEVGGLGGDIVAAILRNLDESSLGSAVLQVWAEGGSIDPEIGDLVRAVFARMRESVIDMLAAWAVENPPASGVDSRTWATEVAPVVLGVVQGFMIQKSLIEDFDAAAYIAGVRAAM